MAESVNGKSDSDILELIPAIAKLKKLVFLRHQELVKLLQDFNAQLDLFTRDENETLEFTIEPDSDKPIFWKASIRIICLKVFRVNKIIVDRVTLNLNQFLSVHQSLVQQINVLEKCMTVNELQNSGNEASNSSSFSTAKLSFNIPNDNECCICMDRPPNLVLPCTHRFCDECFREWFSQTSLTSSQTCPLCRVDVTSDSGFLLTERPSFDNVKQSLTQSILSLPSEYRNRTRASSFSLSHPHQTTISMRYR